MIPTGSFMKDPKFCFTQDPKLSSIMNSFCFVQNPRPSVSGRIPFLDTYMIPNIHADLVLLHNPIPCYIQYMIPKTHADLVALQNPILCSTYDQCS